MFTDTETTPLAWLEATEQQRRAAGLRRSLRPRAAVAPELDLASNDYLGLAQHPAVIEAGVAALRTWGAGSTGSRLVTGDTELHQQFEQALADFVGAPAALVFSSGYTANLGAVVALSGPGSLLVSDAYSHASLVDACRLSRARVQITAHRPVPSADVVQVAQRRQGAVGTEDRIGDHQRPLLGPGGQRRLHGADVAVRRDLHPGARQPAGIDQGRVGVGVRHQQ